jgi:hypothetical protein
MAEVSSEPAAHGKAPSSLPTPPRSSERGAEAVARGGARPVSSEP